MSRGFLYQTIFRRRVVQSVQRKNFGRNQVLRPSAAYTPSDEQEVLQILDRHNGQRIRAVGRLHSWSEAVLSDDVLMEELLSDLRVDMLGHCDDIGGHHGRDLYRVVGDEPDVAVCDDANQRP